MSDARITAEGLARAGVDPKTLLQAVVFLFTIMGGIVGIYVTMESRISVQSERITILQQQLTEVLRQQQHSLEEQKGLAREVGQSLTKLSEQMSDLRVSVAEKRGVK